MFDFDDLVYVDTSNALSNDMMLLRDVDLEQIRIYVGLPSLQKKCNDTQELISEIVEHNVTRACAVVNERELELASYASLTSAPDRYKQYLTEPLPVQELSAPTFLSYVYDHKLQVNEEFTLWYMDKMFSVRPIELAETPYPVLCKGRLSQEYILETSFYFKGALVKVSFNDQGATTLDDFSDLTIVNGLTLYQNGYSDVVHYLKPKIDGIQVISLAVSPSDPSLPDPFKLKGALIHYDAGYHYRATTNYLYDSVELLGGKYYISRRDFNRISGVPDFPYVVVDMLSPSDTSPIRPDTDGFIIGTLFQEHKLKDKHTVDLLASEGGLKTSDGVRVASAIGYEEGCIYECDIKGKVIRSRPDKTLPQDCRTIAKCKRLPSLLDYQERVVANPTPYKEYILPSFRTLRENGITRMDHLCTFEKNYIPLPQEYKDRYLCLENTRATRVAEASSLIEVCSSVCGSHRVINTEALMYTILEAGYAFSPLSMQLALHESGCFRISGKWIGPLCIAHMRYISPDDSRFSVYRLKARKYKVSLSYLNPIVALLMSGKDLSTLEIKQLLANKEYGGITVSLKALNKAMPEFATRKITSTGSLWRIDTPAESSFIAAILSELDANKITTEQERLVYVRDQGFSDPEVVVALCGILSLLRKGMSILVAMRIILGISRDDAHSLVCDTTNLYNSVKVRTFSKMFASQLSTSSLVK